VMIRQGETRIATVKSNFAQPQGTGEKTYKSTLTLEFFVCETRLWGLKELEAYSELDLGGAVVLHYKGDAKRLISGKVTPGTAADAELQFVCAPLVEPSR
jgi:hypothetical protein